MQSRIVSGSPSPRGGLSKREGKNTLEEKRIKTKGGRGEKTKKLSRNFMMLL